MKEITLRAKELRIGNPKLTILESHEIAAKEYNERLLKSRNSDSKAKASKK